MTDAHDRNAERIRVAAQAAHEAYEELAPLFGYETRLESAVPWDELPANHRALMCASIGMALSAAADFDLQRAGVSVRELSLDRRYEG